MAKLFGPGGMHRFQCDIYALEAHQDWQESRSRKDLMKFLAKRWVVRNHKKLYPEEYV